MYPRLLGRAATSATAPDRSGKLYALNWLRLPAVEKVEGERLHAENVGPCFEENGVTITIHALSTYLKNLALPKEQAPVKAASKGTVGPARSHEDLHNLSQDTKTFRILLEDRSVIGDIDPYCPHGDLDRN